MPETGSAPKAETASGSLPLLGDGFDVPSDAITPLEIVFPACGCDPEFLPGALSIPADHPQKAEWDEFHSHWMFSGLPDHLAPTPRPGINGEAAWNHLQLIQGSYGSKHEHKVAALSWLSYRWFVSYGL